MPILGGTGNASEYAYRSFINELPNPFDWPDIINAVPGTTYYSGYAKITGIKKSLRLTITPGYSYSITSNVFDNGQTVTFDNNKTFEASFDEYSDPNLRFTSSTGRVKNNQSIILKVTPVVTPSLPKTSFDATRFRFNDFNPRFDSINEPVNAFAGDFNTVYRPIVSVGKSTQDWIVQTKTLDQTPNSFSFVNVTNQQTSSISTSNYVVITGLEPYYKFDASIIVGTFSGIVVDERVALASTQVYNGNIIKLQTTTSSDFNTPKNIQVKVGTFTTSWTATTELENLNITFTPTDFTDQTGVQLSENIDSDQITLSGFSLNSDLPVTLSNTNAKYEVERSSSIVKSFDASPIEVVNNDKIRLRLTSSASYSNAVTTTMTIGNTSADWSVTTRSAPPPPVVTPPPSGGGGGTTTTYSIQNVYRFWTGSVHLYSNKTEVTYGGRKYSYETTIGKSFSKDPSSVINELALYDFNLKDGFGWGYSPNITNQPTNTIEIYRLTNGTSTLYATSNKEGTASGYRLVGRAWWAPTKNLTV